MWAPADRLNASAKQRERLEQWAGSPTVEQRVALRSRIVLCAIAGDSNNAIAGALAVSRPTVLLWRERFAAGGPDALLRDLPRGAGKPKIPEERVRAVIDATLHAKPAGATHWSVRTMARAQGLSRASVQRIWAAHEIKPHLVRTFKLSRDPRFVEKLRDIVGLYMNPPDNALVLCFDEKSQIQALDRTQPGLPLKKGRCGTMTHDYKRNGTTTLFAALSMLDGKVIGECMPRHTHKEFLRFLKRIEKDTPDGMALHVVLDNYGTHKHPAVVRWLQRHPRIHFHFTPTSGSWLNLVERWFRELTDKAIRRGVFRSVDGLVETIHEYLEHWNGDPKPFVWRARASAIISKVNRCKAKMETLH